MFDVNLAVYLAFVVNCDATMTFDVFNVILSLIRFVINNDLKHRLVITLVFRNIFIYLSHPSLGCYQYLSSFGTVLCSSS